MESDRRFSRQIQRSLLSRAIRFVTSVASSVALVFVVATAVAATTTDPTSGATASKTTPPKYVYSWVHVDTLRRTFENIPGGLEHPFFKILDPKVRQDEKQSAFIQNYPQLKDKVVRFGWINPATASRGAASERYGEVLVRYEIKPEARAVALESSSKIGFHDVAQFNSLPAEVSNAEVFFHDGTVREWVITPSAVRRFTADPEEMREAIEAEIKRLSDPNFQYPHSEIHYSGFDKPFDPHGAIFTGAVSDRNYAIFRLRQFLKHGAKIVPFTYLKSENLGQVERAKSELAKNPEAMVAFRADETNAILKDRMATLLSFKNTKDEVWLYQFREDPDSLMGGLERAKKLLSMRLKHAIGEENKFLRRPRTEADLAKLADEYMRPLLKMDSDVNDRIMSTLKKPEEIKPEAVLKFLHAAADETSDPKALVGLYTEMLGAKPKAGFPAPATHAVSKLLKSASDREIKLRAASDPCKAGFTAIGQIQKP